MYIDYHKTWIFDYSATSRGDFTSSNDN